MDDLSTVRRSYIVMFLLDQQPALKSDPAKFGLNIGRHRDRSPPRSTFDISSTLEVTMQLMQKSEP